MRKFIEMLCCALLLAGCAGPKSTAPKPDQPKPVTNRPTITPDFRPVGKVASVNLDSRFVVINYSPGEMPQADARLSIYHNGLKAAEVKVDSRARRDNNIVADILTGDVQTGDEARQD
jgi:hypothetical protein